MGRQRCHLCHRQPQLLFSSSIPQLIPRAVLLFTYSEEENNREIDGHSTMSCATIRDAPHGCETVLLKACYKHRCTEGMRSCNKTTNYEMLHFFEVALHTPYSRPGFQIDFVFALLLASVKPVNTGSALITFSTPRDRLLSAKILQGKLGLEHSHTSTMALKQITSLSCPG